MKYIHVILVEYLNISTNIQINFIVVMLNFSNQNPLRHFMYSNYLSKITSNKTLYTIPYYQ